MYFNAAQASAQGMNNAMNTTAGLMGPVNGGGATIARKSLRSGAQFQPGQIATTDLSAYMNPYQNQVIDNAISDMDRARQITANDIGAQASAAGAFGGSRHGLVEAENNRNFTQQAGDLAAQMRQSGFQNAQNMAQQDIANDMQGQQIRNSSALGALNARATQDQIKLHAAGQLAGQAGQAFDQYNTINNSMMQSGAMQQALQQQIIDAAKGQYGGFTGAPTQALNLPLMALGATPNVGTQTTNTSSSPGLFGALGLGASLLPFI